MKKIILGLLATTLVAGPLATAASAQRGPDRERTVTRVVHRDNGRTVVRKHTVVRQPQYRTWRKGERFDRRYARNYRQIDYRQYRGLRAPPRGYTYYRSGNDAVLVALGTGVIASVMAGIIR